MGFPSDLLFIRRRPAQASLPTHRQPLTLCERHWESGINTLQYPPVCNFFFDAQALNSPGDSWHLDLHYMWTTLVVGHSLGFLWVCLAVNRSPGGFPFLVLRVPALPSGFGGFLFGHFGAVCVSFLSRCGDLARSPPLFSWVPSLSYPPYEKKTMCVISNFVRVRPCSLVCYGVCILWFQEAHF